MYSFHTNEKNNALGGKSDCAGISHSYLSICMHIRDKCDDKGFSPIQK